MKHTEIPNKLMDVLVNKALNETEKAIVLFVARKTYGYHKKSDAISLTQFERKLGYSRPTINRALSRLKTAGILLVKPAQLVKYGKACNEWTIDLEKLPEGLVKMAQLVKVNASNLVKLGQHTKENNTKENNNNNIENKETFDNTVVKDKEWDAETNKRFWDELNIATVKDRELKARRGRP